MCACMHEECGCIKYDDAESRTVGAGGGGSGSRNRRKFHRPLRHLADEITAWVNPRSPTIGTPTPKPLTFPVMLCLLSDGHILQSSLHLYPPLSSSSSPSDELNKLCCKDENELNRCFHRHRFSMMIHISLMHGAWSCFYVYNFAKEVRFCAIC